ncbi:class III lanthionine synthetase LanKC [Actinoplanes sp. NPDC049548]|uniref:class III lanthionine synthetase LanKC n=1 Tax=Actinoplanes sp. NPDC049548 TaxID=3155152 RepID=UPI00343AA256
MNPEKNLLFCLADPRFFDTPARMPDGAGRFAAADRALPQGWAATEQNVWVVLKAPDAPLPPQGWKIHVAGTLSDAERVLDLVWDFCTARGLNFKFLRSRSAALAVNSKTVSRSSGGKLVTIYPVDEDQLTEALTGLAALLDGSAGPYILGDLRYGAGPLHVRYGAFIPLYCPDEAGEPEPARYGPDGHLVPDVRGPVFQVPDGVALPEVLRPHLDALHRDATEFPYQVEQALHFSNSGGIYLAVKTDTGERVVLREARPHAGLDAAGEDAVARLGRERAALTRLAGLSCVPAVFGYRVCWEHHFLEQEYVDGRLVITEMFARYPFVHPDPSPEALAEYRSWAMNVVDQVQDALSAIHARGVRFGDLHPGNIMLRPDGTVVLIDFESAGDLAEPLPPALGVPGFAAPAGCTGADVDLFALDCLRLYLLLPMTQLIALEPGTVPTLARAAGELFGAPVSLGPRLRRLVDRTRRDPGADPAEEAAARFAQAEPDWPGIRDALVGGIRASATLERADRLFPGDPAQFVTGGVTLRTGAAGVLLALHRVGADVPDEYVRWLAGAARRYTGKVTTGLYDGLHGVALTLDLLGRCDEALDMLDRARASDDRVAAAGIVNGAAGVALNLLHFWRRTGDNALWDAAARAGEELAALIRGDAAPPHLRLPARVGLTRGLAGPALLLIHLYAETGESRYLDAAATALRRDLDRCVWLADGTLQVRDDTTHLLYLEDGSGGLAMVLREYLRYRDDPRFAAAVAGVRRGCRAGYIFQPGLMQGRAGLIAVLNHLAEPDDRAVMLEHVRRLRWHALPHGQHLAFPGAALQRLSMDLATGSAGVLLALHAVFDGGSVLPFVDTRSPATTSLWTEGR